MVLKIKYLLITKETIDSNCKSSRYQRSEIAGAVFFKNMFVFSSNTDQGTETGKRSAHEIYLLFRPLKEIRQFVKLLTTAPVKVRQKPCFQ